MVSAPAPGERVRLLIVDDDESMRMLCRRFFERSAPARILVTEAESGEEAVARMGSEVFDCILSDYRMGALTGIDVLVYALQHMPRATRILMTGFGTPELKTLARSQALAHEVIEKPMTSGELRDVLRARVLERYLVGPRAPGS